MAYRPKKLPPVILASQSPQRQTLLSTLNIPFEVVPAHIDEQAITAQNQEVRAREIAKAKAEAVQKKHPKAIIMAGDTFVVMGDEALEKPKDQQEAIDMLTMMSGQKLIECTGVCYLDPNKKISEAKTVSVEIVFRTLSPTEIKYYVKTQPVTTWSAAFCPAYHEGAGFIKSISGSFTGFTHGFPMEFFVPLLRKSGVLD